MPVCDLRTTPGLWLRLLILTRIPTPLNPDDVSLLALGLNRAEALEDTPFASTGTWCTPPDEPDELAHVQFWPSALASAGLLPSIATDLGARILWAGPRLTRTQVS